MWTKTVDSCKQNTCIMLTTINAALLLWWSGQKPKSIIFFPVLKVWNSCHLNVSAAAVLKIKASLPLGKQAPTAQSDPEVSQLTVRQRHHFYVSTFLLISTLSLNRYGSWSPFLCQKQPFCYYRVWVETTMALGRHQPISAKCFHLSAICHSSGHSFPLTLVADVYVKCAAVEINQIMSDNDLEHYLI